LHIVDHGLAGLERLKLEATYSTLATYRYTRYSPISISIDANYQTKLLNHQV